MDFKSHYTTRYRKDLSTENFRTKVARRKSLTQKENRDKQYRKSRGLALTDINISPVKESDISNLEANETLVSKKDEKAQRLARNREDLLRRFKEEKQLRKLKEQREKAKLGIFRCGVYKHDAPLPSFVPMQSIPPVRQEKCPEARVTRSTAKSNLDNIVKTSKVQRSVANTTSSNKVSVERHIQSTNVFSTASRKRIEKENIVFPVATNTRTTKVGVSAATRRLPNAISATVKPALKPSTGVCPQRKVVPKEKTKVTEIKAEKLEKTKDAFQRETTLVQPTFNFIETKVEKEKVPTKKIRELSFAPLNFQFQPMNGIPTFKFHAMTPRSTNAFLSPCFSWSPAKIAPLMDTTCVKEAGMGARVHPRSLVPVKSLTIADSGSLSFSENESSEVQQLVGAAVVVPEPTLPEKISKTNMEKECSESPEVKMEESAVVKMEESAVVKMEESPEVKMEESPEVKMEESPEVKMEESPEVKMEESPEVKMEESPEVKMEESLEVKMEESLEVKMEESPEVKMEESPEVKMGEKVCSNVPETTEQEKECSTSENMKHDVPYFRETLQAEIERLTLKCVHWDQINGNLDIPEDAKALIRTTVGQTRLLMAERFKQFEGLVDDCEFKRGERVTTCTDLDGFWDMIHFQIEDVLKKFEDLGKLQENNWQQVTAQAKKVKKRIVPSAASEPNATSKQPNQGETARAAARNRLAVIKAALRNKIQQEDALPVPTDVQATKDVDTVVFDAGFFKVESPAKPATRSSCKAHQRLLSHSSGAKCESSHTKVSNQQSTEPLGVSGFVVDSGKAAEHLTDALPSPNDLLSTVKKVLFGSTENVQRIVREDVASPVTEDVDHTNTSMNTASDTDAHTLANQSCSSGPCQSPELTGFQIATESPTVDNIESVDCQKIHGGVVCSPERKIKFYQQEAAFLENSKDIAMRNPALDFCCDPLDFLRSGTPPNLTMLHSSDLPAKELTASDLIVFSPAI